MFYCNKEECYCRLSGSLQERFIVKADMVYSQTLFAEWDYSVTVQSQTLDRQRIFYRNFYVRFVQLIYFFCTKLFLFHGMCVLNVC